MIVTDFNDILTELQSVQDYTDTFLEADNISETELRGSTLAVYHSRTANLKADAVYWKNKKHNQLISQELDKIMKLSPASAKVFIDNLCSEENRLVTWADRLNSTCQHQLDWCRSLLSKQKEELKQLQFNR